MIGSPKMIRRRFSQYSNIPIFQYSKGVTLIELLIALVISAILIAGIYRGFIHQQRTYATQEQVADMQQNVRIAISRMMREIRMAGFGGVGNVLSGGGVNGFTTTINLPAVAPYDNSITVVGGFDQVSTLAADAIAGQSLLTLTNATNRFDGAANGFISIGGTESNTVTGRAGKVLTLGSPLRLTHKVTDALEKPITVPVFKIEAITYLCGVSDGKAVLQRNENTGGGPQPLANNIENIQFEYFDDANPPKQLVPPIAGVDLEKIRMIRVTVTARTSMKDSDYKGGPDYVEGEGSYRKRQISSNIQIRNMGVSP